MSRFIRIDDAATDERTAFFADLLPEDLDAGDRYRLIGAVDERGIPEGVAAYTVDDNMVSILHVEVYAGLRRQGIGTALINTLLQYFEQTELPFTVQAVYSGAEKEADAFFRSLPSFEVVSGGKVCTITPDVILNSGELKLLAGRECSAKPYTELSNSEKNQLIRSLADKNMESFLKFDGKKLVPDLSLWHIKDGKATSGVIFTQSEDTLELAFLMTQPGDRSNLAGILSEVARRYIKSYTAYDIVFIPVNRDSELLAEHFFKGEMRTEEILTAVSFGAV